MTDSKRWAVSKDQQTTYINALTPQLTNLRAAVGVSQGDLAHLLGISRQTYSAIECEKRQMSWNTYLSLIFFYDYNIATHDMLRSLSAFPTELITQFNSGSEMNANESAIAGIPDSITRKLDGKALHAIRTVIMMEYARCEALAAEDVLRTFESIAVSKPAEQTTPAKVRNIRRRRKKADPQS